MTSEELAQPAFPTAAPAAEANRRLLNAADSAWLRVDRDNNHMIITAVLVLGQRTAFSRVQERLDERLRAYPRLRQRIVEGSFGLNRWEDDPEFEIGRQTQLVQLKEPADRPALEAFVGELMPQTLDPSRPPWRIYYVENYVGNFFDGSANETADEPEAPVNGAALVVRAHHCVADGIALLRVLLSLADEPPDITFPTAAAGWARSGPGRSRLATFAASLRTMGRAALGLVGFLTRRKDPPSRFRSPLGFEKRAAWSTPIALDDVKHVCHTLDATVNDVLLNAAAGALGRTLKDTPEFHPDLVLRGVVPVNLRAREDLFGLGNYFGLVFLPMPVGMTDARERLARVSQAMQSIKASPEALAWFALLRALGRVPSWIEAKGVELFSRKASLVITSLAGPKNALHFCGAEIEELLFWVPSAGNVGLGISVLTYRGKVQLGVATDAGQEPDPRRIVDAFEAEIAELVASTRSQRKSS